MEIRNPKPADADAIYELVAEHETQVLGRPDCTPADIADQLNEPDFDPATDGWLAFDGDRLTGWAWACRRGGSERVDLDVLARTPEAAEALWAKALGRFSGVTANVDVYAEDTAKRAAVAARGFAPATSFHRMRIDHHGPVPAAYLPGVTVEAASPDAEELLRAAHAIKEESFAEHFGNVPQSFDEWADAREASSAHDWGQVLVAKVHGQPAAMLVGTNHFVPDENCGYVLTLGVLPRFRGYGLGRLLLRRAFAADQRRGRIGTILHVDSNNTTPALDLYLSVGMRRVLSIDVWRRAL
ncbi:GNAT family N-acetyltransferase [Acrocarpospora catenulata]|uniref:GNAT family N-acetyltransferase n=1 Tax=Acrocarpospora catenulata TaxID=2836182 RepID=UPI001BDAC6B3|nr:GNAT family N-acetyltransferase [Acrocarpospora catenulata]